MTLENWKQQHNLGGPGRQVLKLADSRGWESTADVARACGVKVNHLYKLLRRDFWAAPVTKRIAEKLGVTMEYLTPLAEVTR